MFSQNVLAQCLLLWCPVYIGWWQQRRSVKNNDIKDTWHGDKSVSVCAVKSLWAVKCSVWVSIHSFKCFQCVWGSHCPDNPFRTYNNSILHRYITGGESPGCKSEEGHQEPPPLPLRSLDPRIWKYTTEYNSISKALCLKHLKLRFFKTRAVPKTQ